jgi:hypothetical protein
MNYSSQLGQDVIVDRYLNGKRNGHFVDLGACWYQNMNNSYFFEKERGWTGVAVEYDPKFTPGWAEHRPNTKHLLADAMMVDYEKLFIENNLPKMIDYLSIDLEPPESTLICLYKVLEAPYEYSVITFEVDYYRNDFVRDESRTLLRERGYILTGEIYDRGQHIDDVWVHPSIYHDGLKL